MLTTVLYFFLHNQTIQGIVLIMMRENQVLLKKVMKVTI
jgi:hypothetical protein